MIKKKTYLVVGVGAFGKIWRPIHLENTWNQRLTQWLVFEFGRHIKRYPCINMLANSQKWYSPTNSNFLFSSSLAASCLDLSMANPCFEINEKPLNNTMKTITSYYKPKCFMILWMLLAADAFPKWWIFFSIQLLMIFGLEIHCHFSKGTPPLIFVSFQIKWKHFFAQDSNKNIS